MIVCTAPNPKIIGGLVNGLEAQGKLLILAREFGLFCSPLFCLSKGRWTDSVVRLQLWVRFLSTQCLWF